MIHVMLKFNLLLNLDRTYGKFSASNQSTNLYANNKTMGEAPWSSGEHRGLGI